ncbi:MAG TPA: heme-dependent oxidative N-demethylase subunit alpha family protein [Elusimicrobiota bacterium]|nr:heme-dependent oxidative N-demethylase subunit alpha family protein [Elusimicrobiota bacterium]
MISAELELPAPARYFPLEKGVYEVAPGLRPLGTSFGNGAADGLVFQIDREYEKFRENKSACRAERLSKYYAESGFRPEVAGHVAKFMADKLVSEHPQWFSWAAGEPRRLECGLSGETLLFTPDFHLARVEGSSFFPAYSSAFDALCCQVQEDVAVVSADESGADHLCALHLCSPGYWAAEEKIGKNFFAIHAPVPGIEKVNAASAAIVRMMIERGPFVRFVWGFTTDRRLNHHPEPPPGIPEGEWRGRDFPAKPFTLRVERQITWGLPEIRSALFFIRVYYIEGESIRSNPQERALLRSSLSSLSAESRRYKGVEGRLDEILDWLDAPRVSSRKA